MAQQLARKRTALGLYSLLLVLPAFVLGGLHWRQLKQEQALELAAVPAHAEAGTRRLVNGVRRRLNELLEAESARYFSAYQERINPDILIGPEVAFVPSPLTRGQLPLGVISWFSWDFRQVNQFDQDQIELGIPAEKLQFEIFGGQGSGLEEWPSKRAGFAKSVVELMNHDWDDGLPVRMTRYERVARRYDVPLSHAVLNTTKETDYECLKREESALMDLAEAFVEVYQYEFHLRFYIEPEGSPRLLATRLVLIAGSPLLGGMPDCYSNLEDGASLVQGFFIDPEWLFGQVPTEVALQVLREGEVFHPMGSPPLSTEDDLLVEKVYLVDALGFEIYHPEDSSYGELQVSIDLGEMHPRHSRQARGFLALAVMLGLSLVTGILLLLRSVKRDLDQAQRTENFVAAVTHELRTPVSAIRLYGEMLRDGWAATEKKQQEYYGRIVQEAHRLETMVERVLENSQVTSVEAKPQPMDLNAFLKNLAQRELNPGPDFALDLEPNLPTPLMTPESVRSIAINLVENARKYAPPQSKSGVDGQIWLRTRSKGKHVFIEVLDRGPGIPDEDKSMVFEAFYRRGDEATRKSKGTGLGLHLVKVQSQSMGGDVVILDREGGGCVFQIRLLVAPEE